MPSVEEALKISQDFLEFAKEVRANNAIKEQQEEEKAVIKVKGIPNYDIVQPSVKSIREGFAEGQLISE